MSLEIYYAKYFKQDLVQFLSSHHFYSAKSQTATCVLKVIYRFSPLIMPFAKDIEFT